MARERNRAGVRCLEDNIIAESTGLGLLVAALQAGEAGLQVPGMTSPIKDLEDADDYMLLYRTVELKDQALLELHEVVNQDDQWLVNQSLRLTEEGRCMAKIALEAIQTEVL